MRNEITHIRPSSGWFDIDWREFWASRELLMLLVKRDVQVVYKQTILGPAWFLIQPVLMAIVFSVVFGRIARIPTAGLPHILFYLSGLLIWNFFQGSLNGASNAFAHGSALFSKVYFPRLVIPVTFPISHAVFMMWNFIVFLLFYAWHIVRGYPFCPTWWLLLLPLLAVYVGLAALGIGLVVAALTTKYRDIRFAMPFILQVWMYSTPVIFSLENTTTPWIKFILLLNPLTVAVEGFRFMFFGTTPVTIQAVSIGLAVVTVMLVLGLGAFNRVQRNFVDTI